MWLGTLRLAFFMHHLDLERPLSTPFGEVPLRSPNDLPERLRDIEYEEPYSRSYVPVVAGVERRPARLGVEAGGAPIIQSR